MGFQTIRNILLRCFGTFRTTYTMNGPREIHATAVLFSNRCALRGRALRDQNDFTTYVRTHTHTIHCSMFIATFALEWTT